MKGAGQRPCAGCGEGLMRLVGDDGLVAWIDPETRSTVCPNGGDHQPRGEAQ